MRFFNSFVPFFTLFSLASAHSNVRAPTPEELAREEIRAREHVIMVRNCEPEIREHVTMRMRRRAEIQKREAEAAGRQTPVSTARPPYHSNIEDTACLTAPEVGEGPYYVNNEFIRSDIRETQPGVPLLMDFGVLDIVTCTPMNNAFVEIWATNATGVYGGYNSDAFNSTETWLRGGWYTDKNGVVEVATIYPGHYSGRAPHVHLMVHKDWVQSANGTLVSHSGTVLHVGQTFFPESWNDQVYQTWPYLLNTHKRTPNSQDRFLAAAQRNGYNAYTKLQYLNGGDVHGGLVGYLTLTVDSRSSYRINNKHYNGERRGLENGGVL